MKSLAKYFKNKKVLIFGGTGSWGSELVRQMVNDFELSELRIVSRGEHKQVEMRHRYQGVKNLRFIIGDVRDPEAVDSAMKGVDIVFNLAALKHVPVCEENSWESILTNIHGPQNIVTAAFKHEPEAVIQVSTDKAVDPLNTYGFTKGVAERIMVGANFSPAKGARTKFVCVRGGNVLGTNGSVVPLFKQLIQNFNRVPVTHKDMSRFLMRVEEAICLVLEATLESQGGEVFVMRMPGAKITDLAAAMVKELGNAKTKIEFTGIRPGEKMYEVLVSRNEAPRTYQKGQYYVILPEVVHAAFKRDKFLKLPSLGMEEYNSQNTHQLDQKSLIKLLKTDGWLKPDTTTPFSTIFSPYKEKANKGLV